MFIHYFDDPLFLVHVSVSTFDFPMTCKLSVLKPDPESTEGFEAPGFYNCNMPDINK